jgi:hypothetical protein
MNCSLGFSRGRGHDSVEFAKDSPPIRDLIRSDASRLMRQTAPKGGVSKKFNFTAISQQTTRGKLLSGDTCTSRIAVHRPSTKPMSHR